ncbi:dihydrodipicolinate synthase family protein [Paraburkholderia nemoris]|jgi:4-hydroxy-tetrahydrodipicolinate synthase|uniref:5-dehydro-4-deoxyglucarate dehydratase n=1 Tax=Paraburkholderia nemoris TaxID=2793076 RepID=A0ABM8T453_9BURK|nr:MULTISPECIES: dihydrodipicolinate synthase family protein [Paraburkholderia]MBK3813219.1 dihydrodipicolinate synthase family protein [Paraburkholderia aspalathi]CAE6796624.1 5-dehydro-4-deoxyglucarate dehydratase [Paraburkholderia nemoris]CAE6856685.1 5-dehydro-4-deoxyglucarate dehydratase [Paraburkholderia nemoris]
MNESPILDSEFVASVMAVPPLARRADYTLDVAENRALIRHIEAGGVRTLLYGGNANLYHVAVSEYRDLLDMLADAAGAGTRVIPSIGPDYGKMLDQARILAQTRYRTAMVLPLSGFTTSEGVEAGLSRLADAAGMPLTLYIKSENYVELDTLARLIERGMLLAVKYAIVRDNPAEDPYLRRLLQSVPAAKVVSGMGERPALVHLREFGLAAWTTGSGCIAPRMVMALLQAVRTGDANTAQRLHDAFLPLETLRDEISLIRVLHDAVTFSKIADMGPILPLLSSTPPEHHAKIDHATQILLALERQFAQKPAPH